MKRNNKKGFTIVELVIVIAVIGILAAVLIPTFSGIITKANENADLQTARNEYTEYLVLHPEADIEVVKLADGKYYDVKNDFTFATSTTSTKVLDVNNWGCTTDTNNDGKCDGCGATIE